ncbi:hypothetical protein BGZ58_011242 [Dissophora ornata]|nr:hypothetical protein BGZ58_011242 [Dissophora ornata]
MEFGEASEAGRKVDCIFKYLDIEMSNIEFKCADISERDLAIQNRKNIRLARCIQESHVAIGVHDPCVLMADVFGFVGIFYQVMPMDEISIAGKTTSTIVHIPRTEGGLLSFLKGASLAIIWNYMAHLQKNVPIVSRAKEQHDIEQEKVKLLRSLSRPRSVTPPPATRQFKNNLSVILRGVKARVECGQESSSEAKVYAALMETVAGLGLNIEHEEEHSKSKL